MKEDLRVPRALARTKVSQCRMASLLLRVVVFAGPDVVVADVAVAVEVPVVAAKLVANRASHSEKHEHQRCAVARTWAHQACQFCCMVPSKSFALVSVAAAVLVVAGGAVVEWRAPCVWFG